MPQDSVRWLYYQIQELSRPDSLRDFRLRTQHYAAERNAHIARASRALEHINSIRAPGHRLWTCNGKWKRSTQVLQRSGGIMTKAGCFYFHTFNTTNCIFFGIEQDRPRGLRETLSSLHRTLSAVKPQSPSSPSYAPGDASREAQ